jgi:Secretion system C-terminal sorting domain/GEVED domain
MKHKIFTTILIAISFLCNSILTKAQLCSPTFSNGCFNWQTTSIVAGSINWTAPATCTNSNFTTISTTVASGGSLPMTVVNGNFCGCSVWVDFNYNNLLDSSENLYSNYIASGTATYNFSITIPAAVPNGTYTMRFISSWGSSGTGVSINGTGGCGAYQYGNFQDFSLIVGAPTPCNPPTNIVASNILATSAIFNWAAIAGANSYEYAITTSPTPPASGTFNASNNLAASSLLAATNYFIHIRTYCGAGNYSAWSSIPFTTALPPCLAPSGIALSNLTATSATFNWGAVATAANYEYVIDQVTTAPSGSGTSIVPTTYNAASLVPSTIYYLHLRTNCGAGGFSPWTIFTFATPAITCLAPTGVASSNITTTSANFTWNSNPGATSYEYIINNSGAIPSVSGTNITGTSHIANALMPGTNYFFHIRSKCGNGIFSPWYSASFTTLAPVVCDPPTNLMVFPGQLTAELIWIASTNAINYEYEVNTTNIPPAGSGIVVGGTTVIENGLTQNTSYTAFVRANCGNGIYSAWVSYPFMTGILQSINELSNGKYVNISIAPNPIVDILTVSLKEFDAATNIKLTDIYGRVLITSKAKSKVDLDCSSLAPGIYLLNVSDMEHQATIKVVVE